MRRPSCGSAVPLQRVRRYPGRGALCGGALCGGELLPALPREAPVRLNSPPPSLLSAPVPRGRVSAAPEMRVAVRRRARSSCGSRGSDCVPAVRCERGCCGLRPCESIMGIWQCRSAGPSCCAELHRRGQDDPFVAVSAGSSGHPVCCGQGNLEVPMAAS